MPLREPKIVVTRRLPGAIQERLRTEYGAELNDSDRQFTADDLHQAFRDFSGRDRRFGGLSS